LAFLVVDRTYKLCFSIVIIILNVSDEFCEEYPHNLIPTPGYWIECSRQKIATDTIWDESESEHDSGPDRDDNGKFLIIYYIVKINDRRSGPNTRLLRKSPGLDSCTEQTFECTNF
jgi:hypothetical protein